MLEIATGISDNKRLVQVKQKRPPVFHDHNTMAERAVVHIEVLPTQLFLIIYLYGRALSPRMSKPILPVDM